MYSAYTKNIIIMGRPDMEGQRPSRDYYFGKRLAGIQLYTISLVPTVDEKSNRIHTICRFHVKKYTYTKAGTNVTKIR